MVIQYLLRRALRSLFGQFATSTTRISGALPLKTERWGQDAAPELQYTLTVPNGSYLVRLHFAENYAPNFAVGKRVFDVDIEGVQRFDNIDVFREAGGARSALVKSTVATVNDGQLNIRFRHQTQNPIIDAIEVIGQ